MKTRNKSPDEIFLDDDGFDRFEIVPEGFNIAETVEETIEELGLEHAAPYAEAMSRFTELWGWSEISADWKEVERLIRRRRKMC